MTTRGVAQRQRMQRYYKITNPLMRRRLVFFYNNMCNVECLLRAKILTVDLSCLATKPWDLNTALYKKHFKKDTQHLQICFKDLKIGQTQTLWGLKVLEDNTPTVSSPWKCHLQQRGLCDPKATQGIQQIQRNSNMLIFHWTSSVQMMLIRLMYTGHSTVRQENSRAKAPPSIKIQSGDSKHTEIRKASNSQITALGLDVFWTLIVLHGDLYVWPYDCWLTCHWKWNLSCPWNC